MGRQLHAVTKVQVKKHLRMMEMQHNTAKRSLRSLSLEDYLSDDALCARGHLVSSVSDAAANLGLYSRPLDDGVYSISIGLNTAARINIVQHMMDPFGKAMNPTGHLMYLLFSLATNDPDSRDAFVHHNPGPFGPGSRHVSSLRCLFWCRGSMRHTA